MSLADDVAELFSGLDGYERYELRLAVEAVRNDPNAYSREYRRERYAWDASYRRSRSEASRRWHLKTYVRKRKYGPVQVKHGSINGYINLCCRCPVCVVGNCVRMREYRATNNGTLPRSYGPIEAKHGTVSAYNCRGCRCDRCRAAITAYSRERRVVARVNNAAPMANDPCVAVSSLIDQTPLAGAA